MGSELLKTETILVTVSMAKRGNRAWSSILFHSPSSGHVVSTQYLHPEGGLEMKTTARKWGNSLAIRVPKRVAEEAGLREKDSVKIEVRKGMLVVRPYLRRVYQLEDLLKRITPRNVHDEVDFGRPVGREAL